MTALELFAELRPIAERAARRVSRLVPPSVHLDDLRNAAALGLWTAIIAHGTKPLPDLTRLATARIRGAIADELRTESYLSRRQPRTHRMAYLDAFREDQQPVNVTSPEPPHVKRLDLMRAIARLPERRRGLIIQRLMGRTTLEISRELGITEARISQLCAPGLAAIRKVMSG